MAISPVCSWCGDELTEPGGLLFSPPNGGLVWKHHLCVTCYEAILATERVRRAGLGQQGEPGE